MKLLYRGSSPMISEFATCFDPIAACRRTFKVSRVNSQGPIVQEAVLRRGELDLQTLAGRVEDWGAAGDTPGIQIRNILRGHISKGLVKADRPPQPFVTAKTLELLPFPFAKLSQIVLSISLK